MAENKTRKLAAILFADIQGYSALMEKDESVASALLAKFRNILTEKVASHDGRIVNFYGDGCLAVFESPLQSVQCAAETQKIFLTEPKVPVRIGLHSGVVVYEDDNVYGDSVNQASRVESMGLAGSVLISESIRRHIKNHPQYQTILLGSYEFKNIEEPMQVYALANDDFTVPKASEIRGKLKAKKSSIYKWLVPALVAVLTLAALGTWQSALNSSDAGVFSSNSLSASPLSKEMRDKRMAVMVFENQTMSESMDAFGKMISDWITRGLMETGEANVISAANIETQIAQAGLSGGANPEFARTTGVDIMLNGRYYLQEDRLIIHSNIFEVATGEVIHAVQPIEGPKDKMIDLLEELTQEVLGYWAVKKVKRYLQNPPKYEAYQKYIEGNLASYTDFESSESLLVGAFQEDTTFYAPLLKLVPLYSNHRLRDKADSVISFVQTKKSSLTKWEQLRLAALSARAKGDLIKSAQMNEAMFEMDQSDENANYNAGSRYLQSNYPKKSLEVFSKLDQRYTDLEGGVKWSEARMATAHNRLGEYEKALQVVGSYNAPELYRDLVFEHLRSTIRLDSFDLLSKLVDEYLAKDIYNQVGSKESPGLVYAKVCGELYILDHENQLQHYASNYRDWINREDSEKLIHKALAAYYLREYNTAIDILEQFNWSTINSGQTIRFHGLLGICYAKLGQKDKAQNVIDKIMKIEGNHMVGLNQYGRAGVEAALRLLDKAMASLEESLSLNMNFYPGFFMEDPALKPLFDHPEFQDMVKPKG